MSENQTEELTQPVQLTLAYVEIKEEDIAPRKMLREDKDGIIQGAIVNYKVPFDRIKIRDGFNKRTIYEGIEELADSIFAYGGLETPLTVDMLKDGTIYIEKGHRRYRAIELLIEQKRGQCVELVDCFVNSRYKTELQRMTDIYSSNMHSHQLKPIDQASVAFTIKHDFGYERTNEEVAKLLGVSRQKIDYLILIWEQDDEVKNEIRKGNMSFTDAVKHIRAAKKAQKEANKVEEESHKTPTTVQPPQDLLKKDMQGLEALESTGGNKADDLNSFMDEGEEEQDNQQNDNDGWKQIGEEITEEPGVPGGVVPVYQNMNFKVEGEPEFDINRVEIQQCNNVIKLLDQLDVIASKLPDAQTSKDMSQKIKWAMNSAIEVRLYVHRNNKINKRDH